MEGGNCSVFGGVGLKVMAIWLSGINIVSFTVYGIDKYRAVRRKFRISERTLLLLAAVGGSVGAYVAMRIFRHKTLKKRFSAGVPLMLILHLLCFALLCKSI